MAKHIEKLPPKYQGDDMYLRRVSEYLEYLHKDTYGVDNEGGELNDDNISSISASTAGAIADAVGSVTGTNVGFDADDVSAGSSNKYYTEALFNASFSGKSTTDLSEGTNLYYTDERVDDRVDALIQDGNAITWTYDDANGTLTGELNEVAAVTDESNADATDLPTAITLINSLKAKFNDWLAKSRTADHLAT